LEGSLPELAVAFQPFAGVAERLGFRAVAGVTARRYSAILARRAPVVVHLASTAHLIVVMPDAGYSYYTNAKHKRNARWEDAVTGELRHDVESRFPVLRGREHAGIAGISMGGYGAVKLALQHPELYGFAGGMSGALDITRRSASAAMG
jgi:S-formylglutathione hydrolase FrmB